jgi:hypothetical protein
MASQHCSLQLLSPAACEPEEVQEVEQLLLQKAVATAGFPGLELHTLAAHQGRVRNEHICAYSVCEVVSCRAHVS